MRIQLMVCLAATSAAYSATPPGNAYLQHNLVADLPGTADFTDPNLVNAWGIATSATSPFWVNDGGTGLATLYSSSGAISTTKVTVPPSAAGSAPAVATGIVFNGTGGFAVAPGHNPNFIFATQDGTISGWSSAVNATTAIVKVDNSASGAVYDGLAISASTTTASPMIYAANFHSGAIDVFDTNYVAVSLPGAFADPAVPAGFAPFNIQNLGGKLYVTYAKQDAAQKFDVSGVGNGYVSVFDLNGKLLQHLVSGGPLNSPWGLAIAPANFGAFSGDLIVGNFGDGFMNAFDPATGALLGTLQDQNANPIELRGLWGLIVGNGGNGGDVNALYFASGPGGQKHGLFGSLQAAPVITTSSVMNAASFQPGIAPNTWIAITGANMAATTRAWKANDIKNGQLPTTLDGVTVTVNGKPAYLSYISPKQINALTSPSTSTSAVQVQTSNGGLTSASIAAQAQVTALACFIAKGNYLLALHSDGKSLVGPTTLYPGFSTPAKPGETIVLFGTGFGTTNPPAPDGQVIASPSSLSAPPIVIIGVTQAQVAFSGLVYPGIYQFNVVVPSGTANGDVAVMMQVGSLTTQAGTLISVQQ